MQNAAAAAAMIKRPKGMGPAPVGDNRWLSLLLSVRALVEA
jgi:hypothetical protein